MLARHVKRKKTGDLGDNCLANERTHNNEVLWSSSTERVVKSKNFVKYVTKHFDLTRDLRSRELKQVTFALLAKRFIINANKPKRSPQQSVAATPEDVKSFCVLLPYVM